MWSEWSHGLNCQCTHKVVGGIVVAIVGKYIQVPQSMQSLNWIFGRQILGEDASNFVEGKGMGTSQCAVWVEWQQTFRAFKEDSGFSLSENTPVLLTPLHSLTLHLGQTGLGETAIGAAQISGSTAANSVPSTTTPWSPDSTQQWKWCNFGLLLTRTMNTYIRDIHSPWPHKPHLLQQQSSPLRHCKHTRTI